MENQTCATAIDLEEVENGEGGQDQLSSVENIQDESEDDLLVLEDVPAVDEIPHMINVLTTERDADRKRLSECIFHLLCCYVGDELFCDFPNDKLGAVCDAAAIKMIAFNENDAVMRKEYFREQFVRYLPENAWTDFKQYFAVLSSAEPSAKFREQNKKLDESQLRTRFFGEMVFNTFKAIKTKLNTIFNPHWKPSILNKSGSTPSKVFYAIRKWAYEKGMDEKAEESLKNAKAYQDKQKKKGKVIKGEEIDFSVNTREWYLEQRRAMLVEKDPFSHNHYDKAWACFVLFGRPAEDSGHHLVSLVSGNPKRPPLTMANVDSIRDYAAKRVRREVDRNQTTPQSLDSKDSTPRSQVVVRIEKPGPTLFDHESELIQLYVNKLNSYKDMQALGIPVSVELLEEAYANFHRAMDAKAARIQKEIDAQHRPVLGRLSLRPNADA